MHGNSVSTQHSLSLRLFETLQFKKEHAVCVMNCQFGKNRSAALAVAVMMLIHSLPCGEAVTLSAVAYGHRRLLGQRLDSGFLHIMQSMNSILNLLLCEVRRVAALRNPSLYKSGVDVTQFWALV
jgi:hypothetical protein